LKFVFMAMLASVMASGASTEVDVYSPQDLHSLSQKLAARSSGFASQALEKYSNHYTMLAFRDKTGSAEVHEKEADIFVVVDGTATLLSGGKLVSPRTEKPGELRAASIEGGKRQPVEKGSLIHIPAGVPHQLLIENGPFTYFVVKVTGQ
jgi:mannose-6-phosphate isomerase-like protein (cupin superfamily)